MRKWLVGFVIVAFVLVQPVAANAQRRLSFIRDAETEHILRAFATPIFQAAGLVPQSVNIFIVQDQSLNAFVAGGQNMFFNTGLLTTAENPLELIGVMAHEAGHIAGGHLARGQDALERAQRTALISTLLGIAAAIATGEGGLVGAGAISGGQVATRGFLSFSRTMESSADQAALTYLDRAGLSSEGLMSFLEALADQELLPIDRQSEYVRTHPLTFDRIQLIRDHVAQSPVTGQGVSPEAEMMFARMQAKLIGYLNPRRALQVFPEEDKSIPATYGRAIAHYRRGQMDLALAEMNELLAMAPNDPFFNEAAGMILLESGRAAEARQYYERALSVLPGEPLFLIPLAQIKLDGGTDADLAGAVDDLNLAIREDRVVPSMAWRLLATAYGRQGDLGMAALSLAEEALVLRDGEAAVEQAQRAEALLAHGSSGWLRLQDVRRVAEELAEEQD